MILIDNYPNTERAITAIEVMIITKKEYIKLIKLSQEIKSCIEKELNCELPIYGIIKYYIENTIINPNNLSNFSQTAKEIIIANILLPETIKVVELLNNNGYTIEHLKNITRFRALLKNIILSNAPIDTNLANQFMIYKKYVTHITELFKKTFGIIDQTIILNRICEILVTYPNLFETKPNLRKR